jgi:ATP-dependent helicase/nuclease subunit B
LFDQLVDLLGDQTVELSDFVQTLESGLEQFDLALTPPTVDQVLVGQVDRTRSVEAKAVFVLGMAEGQFPRVAREDSVLSDAERRALVARSLNVQPDSERKLLDENLYGYLAFTRASETLVLTRAVADAKGNEIAPSVFWERVRGMFPDVVTQQRKESEAEAEDVATPRQLVTGLMRWAREDRERAID